ncbi:unnamed protein product, partial [Pleuronectes platessa]
MQAQEVIEPARESPDSRGQDLGNYADGRDTAVLMRSRRQQEQIYLNVHLPVRESRVQPWSRSAVRSKIKLSSVSLETRRRDEQREDKAGADFGESVEQTEDSCSYRGRRETTNREIEECPLCDAEYANCLQAQEEDAMNNKDIVHFETLHFGGKVVCQAFHEDTQPPEKVTICVEEYIRLRVFLAPHNPAVKPCTPHPARCSAPASPHPAHNPQ